MKAKKVYEFKRTRKQGLSKQTDLSINKYAKHEIEKWFEEFAPNIEYKLYDYDDTYRIDLKHNLHLSNLPNLTWIPDNLNFKGYESIFSVMGCLNLTELPNNIIADEMVIIKTGISKMPDKIRCMESFTLIDNKNLTEFPIQVMNKLYNDPKYKYTTYNNLTLMLFNNNIKEVPDGLIINKDLNLDRNPISELPPNLKVQGDLDIRDTNITHLPETILVMGKIKVNVGQIDNEDDPRFKFHIHYGKD